MNKVKLLMGQFSFLDIENDGVHKAIIHSIDTVIECDSIDEAEEIGEELLDRHESYLVPDTYNGVIDLTDMDVM